VAIAPRGSPTSLKAEINVTPLVDVVLVLLIIFMVVTPLFTRGPSVVLPMASAAEAEREGRDAIVLTIGSDKRLFVESREVTLARLPDELKERLRLRAGREVLIKADAHVEVRYLRPVLRELKQANIRQIAFAVLQQRAGE